MMAVGAGLVDHHVFTPSQACSVNCTELSDNSFKLKYDSKSKGKHNNCVFVCIATVHACTLAKKYL